MNYAEDSDRIQAVQYRQCVVSSYFTGKVWHGTPKSQTIICKTRHCFFRFSFVLVFLYLDQCEVCFLEQGGVFCLDICQHNNYTLVWNRNFHPPWRSVIRSSPLPTPEGFCLQWEPIKIANHHGKYSLEVWWLHFKTHFFSTIVFSAT